MKKTNPAPASTPETQTDLCVLTGEAEKINPHSTGLLHWEMTENLDGERGLRITANDSGGLFSREWIALSAISGVLKTHVGATRLTVRGKDCPASLSARHFAHYHGCFEKPLLDS